MYLPEWIQKFKEQKTKKKKVGGHSFLQISSRVPL